MEDSRGNAKTYYEGYWHGNAADFVKRDPTTPERRRRLFAVLKQNLKAGDPVLDLGCGTGQFTSWIKNSGFDAMGVDISEIAIEKAKSAFPGVNYGLMGENGAIPASDETFVAVWNTEVIEHVLEVDAFLREISRVLRPGGLLILTTPYHSLIKNIFIVLYKFDRHFKVEGSHIRFFNRKALARSFQRTGFIPRRYSGIGRCWPFYRSWFVIAEKAGEN